MLLLHQDNDEVHDSDLCEHVQVFEIGEHLTNRLSCQGFWESWWIDGDIDCKLKQSHVDDFVALEVFDQ